MKVVLVNGCFDILHVGHIEHLREARAMGDRLIVSLTVDEGVKKKGGNRPFNVWEDRAKMLRELRCVNEVIQTENAVSAIRSVRPHYFVKGIDYVKGDRFTENVEEACKSVGAKLVFTNSPKRSIAEILRKAAK